MPQSQSDQKRKETEIEIILQDELQDVSNLLSINVLLRNILHGDESFLLATDGLPYHSLFIMHLFMEVFIHLFICPDI